MLFIFKQTKKPHNSFLNNIRKKNKNNKNNIWEWDYFTFKVKLLSGKTLFTSIKFYPYIYHV